MPALTPCPTLLQDPEEHDFRQPDLAWVGDESFREDLAEANFGNYAAEIWIGPVDQAQAFAAALSDEYEAWATRLRAQHPNRDASDAATAVLYWENADLGLAAVAVVPNTDLSASPERNVSHPAPSRDQFPAMHPLPGTEAISPFEMLQDVDDSREELEQVTVPKAVEFIRSITTSAYIDDLDEMIKELFPELRRRKPRP